MHAQSTLSSIETTSLVSCWKHKRQAECGCADAKCAHRLLLHKLSSAGGYDGYVDLLQRGGGVSDGPEQPAPAIHPWLRLVAQSQSGTEGQGHRAEGQSQHARRTPHPNAALLTAVLSIPMVIERINHTGTPIGAVRTAVLAMPGCTELEHLLGAVDSVLRGTHIKSLFQVFLVDRHRCDAGCPVTLPRRRLVYVLDDVQVVKSAWGLAFPKQVDQVVDDGDDDEGTNACAQCSFSTSITAPLPRLSAMEGYRSPLSLGGNGFYPIAKVGPLTLFGPDNKAPSHPFPLYRARVNALGPAPRGAAVEALFASHGLAMLDLPGDIGNLPLFARTKTAPSAWKTLAESISSYGLQNSNVAPHLWQLATLGAPEIHLPYGLDLGSQYFTSSSQTSLSPELFSVALSLLALKAPDVVYHPLFDLCNEVDPVHVGRIVFKDLDFGSRPRVVSFGCVKNRSGAGMLVGVILFPRQGKAFVVDFGPGDAGFKWADTEAALGGMLKANGEVYGRDKSWFIVRTHVSG